MSGKIIFLKNRNFSLEGDTMAEISRDRMLQIEDSVKEVIKDLQLKDSLSVDIVSLVKQDDFQVETKSMPIETTGMLLVNDTEEKKQRIIVVNRHFNNPDDEEDIVYKKSRFITAHEYGHYKLHKPQNKNWYAHRDSDKREKTTELEADYFARSLLMPLAYFEKSVDVLTSLAPNDEEFLISTLSGLFNVTKKKAKARLKDIETIRGTSKV